jgi:hypothetical protein
MPQPVLVIHGIGVRDPGKFFKSVDALDDSLGDGYELIPVFWGDLGAGDEHLDRVIARYPDRSGGVTSMVADRFAASVTNRLGKTMSWVSRKRGDDEAAARISEQARQMRDDMKGRVRGYVNGKFQDMRGALTAALLPFLADVIVYQSQTQRAVIHQRFREVIDKELGSDYGTAAKPLTVIAHSLGGVITFDMATAETSPLHLETFITLGSQPAFFHMLDPRSGCVPAYRGEPVTLPATFRRWTNIWDELDVLAFGVSEIFRLHDGGLPVDRPVRCYRDPVRGAALLPSHLGYFTRKASIQAIAEALADCQ